MIDLKQLFWSIRGQITYLAVGLICLMVSRTRVMAIPVATGISTHFSTERTPIQQQQIIINKINPYSQIIWRGIKVGGLTIYHCNHQSKIYTRIYTHGNPLPNHQIFAMVIGGPTTKFNSHQYFRLYGYTCCDIVD